MIRLSESPLSSEAKMLTKSILALMERLSSVDLFCIAHGVRSSKARSEVQSIHILALGGT